MENSNEQKDNKRKLSEMQDEEIHLKNKKEKIEENIGMVPGAG